MICYSIKYELNYFLKQIYQLFTVSFEYQIKSSMNFFTPWLPKDVFLFMFTFACNKFRASITLVLRVEVNCLTMQKINRTSIALYMFVTFFTKSEDLHKFM